MKTFKKILQENNVSALTGSGKSDKIKLNEEQDNDTEEVRQARKDYEHHTNEILKLGKQMGEFRHKDIQDKINYHQERANVAQRIFRTFDKQQARNRVAATKVEEEMNVGGIAGTGDERLSPSQREPGVPVKSKYKNKNEQESPQMGDILRRPMLAPLKENTGKFAGHTTHKVPRNVFAHIIKEKAKGKHWRKYLGEHDSTVSIREYANKNPKKPIIIEDEDTGYMCYARYGK